MKIALNTLKYYVDINVSVEELCDKMVMAGFEVESIENLADKIYINAYTYENVEVIEAEQRPLYFHFVKLRQHLRGALYSELHKDTADLASAVLLGDDSFSDETYEALRRSGLTHMVVVSGLHLSILTMLYSKTFGKLTKNKYINALFHSREAI